MSILKSVWGFFEKAVPNPNKENLCVQYGCHLEEVAEMAESTFCVDLSRTLSEDADLFKGKEIEHMAIFDAMDKDDYIALVDSCADQIVTATGILYMLYKTGKVNAGVEQILSEVNRSNYSKFVDGKPVFDKNGKIAKPESYSRPNIEQFVTV